MNIYPSELILLAKDLPHQLINLPRPIGSVFWFGDFVRFGDYIGCVYGVDFRPDFMTHSVSSGYWFSCRWTGQKSLQRVHQENLTFYDHPISYGL